MDFEQIYCCPKALVYYEPPQNQDLNSRWRHCDQKAHGGPNTKVTFEKITFTALCNKNGIKFIKFYTVTRQGKLLLIVFVVSVKEGSNRLIPVQELFHLIYIL